MIEAAHDLGTENLLVVPGAVHIPWRTDHEPVPNDVCDQRAQRGGRQAAPRWPRSSSVSLNIENIFFNGYLMTPGEMNAFVDSLQERARPRPLRHRQHHAVPVPRALDPASSASGSRTSTSRSSPRRGPTTRWKSFRPLLDGTTNWPAVMEAFDDDRLPAAT